MLEGYDEYLKASKMMKPGMLMYYAPQGFVSSMVKNGAARNGGNVMGLSAVPQFCESHMKPLVTITLTTEQGTMYT